jgi:hypothetical protein
VKAGCKVCPLWSITSVQSSVVMDCPVTGVLCCAQLCPQAKRELEVALKQAQEEIEELHIKVGVKLVRSAHGCPFAGADLGVMSPLSPYPTQLPVP